MFFSIIIPVYNREKYICRCIESVIKQSYSNYEVIIVDDGSSDKSGAICDHYREKYKNIKVFHQKNGGVSKARNKGLKFANGNFVIFIDSDDFIPKNYLKKIKETYDKFGTEYFFCTAFKVYTRGGIQLFQYRNSLTHTIVKDCEIFDLMNGGLFNSVCNKVYQMSIIRKYHIQFPENINLGEDLIFNFNYLDRQKKIKLIVLNKVFYHVQESRRSLERGWNEHFFEIQQLLLRKKLKYKNKWAKENKIQINSTKIDDIWYYMCIYGSINYYITRIKLSRILLIIKKIIYIKYSSEYLEYCRIFYKKENRLDKLIINAFLKKVKFMQRICQL